MPSMWQNLRGRFDRSRNPVWGRRMSLLYGMGVWTMLGVLFVKWIKHADSFGATNLGLSQESFQELSEEERNQLIKNKKLATIKRQQELAEHVAEHVYKPVDFMG